MAFRALEHSQHTEEEHLLSEAHSATPGTRMRPLAVVAGMLLTAAGTTALYMRSGQQGAGTVQRSEAAVWIQKLADLDDCNAAKLSGSRCLLGLAGKGPHCDSPCMANWREIQASCRDADGERAAGLVAACKEVGSPNLLRGLVDEAKQEPVAEAAAEAPEHEAKETPAAETSEHEAKQKPAAKASEHEAKHKQAAEETEDEMRPGEVYEIPEPKTMKEAKVLLACGKKLEHLVKLCGEGDDGFMDCTQECQDAAAGAGDCAEHIPPMRVSVNLIKRSCSGCGKAMMELFRYAALCNATEGDLDTWTPCSSECHPYSCGMLTECTHDIKVLPFGLSRKHMNKLHGQAEKSMQECPCT